MDLKISFNGTGIYGPLAGLVCVSCICCVRCWSLPIHLKHGHALTRLVGPETGKRDKLELYLTGTFPEATHGPGKVPIGYTLRLEVQCFFLASATTIAQYEENSN